MQQHRGEVAVAEADFALVGDGAGNAEGLKPFADLFRRRGGCLRAAFYGVRRAEGVGPDGVVKGDRLDAAHDGRDVYSLFQA